MRRALPAFAVLPALALGCSDCSDPPTPPAQAAVAIDLRSTADCGLASFPLSLPSGALEYRAIKKCGGTRSTTDPDCLDDYKVVNRKSGNSVECSVSGGGDTWSIQASVSNTNFTFSASGQIGSGGGTLRVSSYNTGTATTLTDPACAVTVRSIDGGLIWAEFNCQDFDEAPTRICEATGTFVFENCSG